MINFASMEINRTDIPQNILNIDARTRTNPFAWNGQFSPQFVEAMLFSYAGDGDYVIDTFAGSGTTLRECAGLGLECYGTEINAPAFHMAKIYEVANLNESARKSVIDSVDSLILFLSMNGGNVLEGIISDIEAHKYTFYSYALSALVIMMDIFNNEVTPELLRGKWEKLASIISGIPYSVKPIKAEMRDARSLSLKDDEADMLLTSPPYINVFNYHQKYRRSAEALGYNALRAAASEIGSNRKNRGNRFLTVIQYCLDMAGTMREAVRVCREGARMIYVVGRESRVMGIPFCNSKLIYEIGAEVFGLDFLMRQERFFMNRYGRMIYEDILHFRNRKGRMIPDGEMNDKVRDIAVRMLAEKMKDADSRALQFLKDAISRKEKVMSSEVFAV